MRAKAQSNQRSTQHVNSNQNFEQGQKVKREKRIHFAFINFASLAYHQPNHEKHQEAMINIRFFKLPSLFFGICLSLILNTLGKKQFATKERHNSRRRSIQQEPESSIDDMCNIFLHIKIVCSEVSDVFV